MPRRSLHQQALYVRDTVERMGGKIHPQSRLGRMWSAVCMPDGSPRGLIKLDDPRFTTVREALHDLQILSFVFDSLLPNDHEFGNKLKLVVKDSALPQEDRTRSPGRDIQFELFVAAVVAAAGMKPKLQEPDVVAVLNGTQFAVAAKRIKTFERLEERIRSAKNQICKCGLPGIIAIDASFALNPENAGINRAVTESTFKWAAERMRAGMVEKYESQAFEITRGTPVRGIVVHDHLVVQENTGSWSLNSVQFAIETVRHNERRQKEFERLYDRYVRALPNRREF